MGSPVSALTAATNRGFNRFEQQFLNKFRSQPAD